MSQPYPSEGEWWTWYQDEVSNRYHRAGLPFPDNPQAFIWFTRCAWDIGDGLTKEASASKHLRELEQALGLDPIEPPIPGDKVVRPIVGLVRTDGRKWGDDTGLRSMRIMSWFPALKCYRDNPDEVRRELDNIAIYWQGIRIFWHVWTARWGNPKYSVDPRWPDFDSLFVSFLQECAARGLRVSLSSGDMQDLVPGGQSEDFWHEHIAHLAATVDHHTASWHGVWNEGWQNTASDRANVETARRICQKRMAIYPWGAHGLTDPAGFDPNGDPESPTTLAMWSQSPANHTLVHGTRPYPDSIRRAFNLMYEGGGFLVNQDEPVGPGPDVYQRDDDPKHLFGLYTMLVISGQMVTYFSGHGLKSWNQAGDFFKDWGFRELPELWQKMDIPEDIANWTKKPGHHGDSAIYPVRFSNEGDGPDRCDGAQTDSRAWFVVSGGRGNWELKSRRNANIQVWNHEGLQIAANVSAGQTFLVTSSDNKALVISSQSF